ncbi:MAG TPA: hypothetical protein VHV75_18915 [Solirubrobacteraceae bacterium]|nr:hypothetical protein [Solirubrobacteraceae bacterium]
MTTIAEITRKSARRDHLVAVTNPEPSTSPRTDYRWTPVVIRLAVAADAPTLRELAHLDSARPLTGPALIAERSGSAVAAVAVIDGNVVADPFVATTDVVELLLLRAAQLRQAAAASAA